MHQIKFAFVGTSCIGKTSIFETLRKEFGARKDMQFVEEAARIYFKAHPFARNRFSFITQGKIQLLAQEFEKGAHASGARVIWCDRSVLDAAAYVNALKSRTGADILIARIYSWLSTYTLIYLLDPKGVPFRSDTIRDESLAMRERLHGGFVDLFARFKMRHKLLSGTQNERLEKVKETLARYIN